MLSTMHIFHTLGTVEESERVETNERCRAFDDSQRTIMQYKWKDREERKN